MKAFHALGFLASVIACSVACQARAQEPTDDQAAKQLVSPDLVLQYKERLQLTPSQEQNIQALVDNAKEKLPDYQAKHKSESQALRDLLKTNMTDEKAVLGQLDKVIVQERNIRRLQLALVIRVYEQLNADQVSDLENIRQEVVVQRRELQQRLQAKFQRAQQLAQQQASAGNPPNDVVEMMKPFGQLLKEGKVQEAENLLDQAISKLTATDDVSDLFSDTDLFPE